LDSNEVIRNIIEKDKGDLLKALLNKADDDWKEAVRSFYENRISFLDFAIRKNATSVLEVIFSEKLADIESAQLDHLLLMNETTATFLREKCSFSDKNIALYHAFQNVNELGRSLNIKFNLSAGNDPYSPTWIGSPKGISYSIHITYSPSIKQLYVYCALLDGLPKLKELVLALYTRLLQGAMLGGEINGGGLGLAVKEELILIHHTLAMTHAKPNALLELYPKYVNTVDKWKIEVNKICNDYDWDSLIIYGKAKADIVMWFMWLESVRFSNDKDKACLILPKELRLIIASFVWQLQLQEPTKVISELNG